MLHGGNGGSPMAQELDEEAYVRRVLGERFGITLRKIPESKTAGEKTADFELLDGDERVAVVEVKTLEHSPRTQANGWKRQYGGWMRAKDNGPARVAGTIHTAWKQLATYDAPKVLVVANDDWHIDVIDLQEAIHGFLDYGTNATGYYRNAASMKIANGRIRDEKDRIDLYVWIDRWKGGEPICRFTTPTGYDLARRFFGCPVVPIESDDP